MIVMIHQAVGMTEPAEAAHHLTQHPQPGLAIRICRDDPLARMAETGDVIYRMREFNSQRPGHGGTVDRSACRIARPDPASSAPWP